MIRFWFAALGSALCLAGNLPAAETLSAPAVPPAAREVAPRFLPLPDWLEPRESMISGLAWLGDDLVLLPQQRRVRGQPSIHRGKAYSIPRAALDQEIRNPSGGPLPVATWTLEAPGIDALDGYEGLEAIAFAGDVVFITVECETSPRPAAWLLRGRADRSRRVIRMEPPSVRIEGRSGIRNLTEEALVVHGGEVLVLHEANGARVNPYPVAHTFPVALPDAGPWTPRTRPMPTIEFRVTDASEADATGRFWVSDYLYPGDTALHAATDAPVSAPRGSRSAGAPWVERLIELRVTPNGILPGDRPPIYLEPGPEPRNWEGVARLDSRGLLMVTDKYPATRLAWVPFPEEARPPIPRETLP